MKHSRSYRAIAFAAALAAPGLFVATPQADAAQKVGAATLIRNQVTASIGGALAVRSPVFRDEKVSAGAASHGELLLDDASRLLVGENSTITLDRFVVSEGGFAKATVNVAKGAFRFISGGSRKGAYTVTTPVSSIGVRGTFFDVYVGRGGETRVVLINGAVNVCGRAGRCILADRPCDVVFVSTAGRPSREPFYQSRQRSGFDTFRNFPLLSNQFPFSPPFWAQLNACALRAQNENPAFEGDPSPAEDIGDDYDYDYGSEFGE